MLELGRRQNMTGWKLNGLEVNAQLTCWFVSFAELSCWFRPHNAQNLLPKICTKLPISQLVWQIHQRCLGLPGGFRGWPIQWNHAKCCGANPCCHGNDIWARRRDL